MAKKITELVVMVFCLIISSLIINVAEASFIQLQSKNESMAKTKSNVIVFESVKEPVKIRVKNDIWDDKLYIMAFKDKKKIYEEVPGYNDGTWNIKEIQDEASGRIFYVLSPGMEPYDIKIMGYDSDKKSWVTYVKSRNFYSGVDTYAEFVSIDGGQLKLTFHGSGWSGNHEYLLFWDNASKWFGYKDLGIRYRKR